MCSESIGTSGDSNELGKDLVHDLAHESHDQFWEKECALSPNDIGLSPVWTIDPMAWMP